MAYVACFSTHQKITEQFLVSVSNIYSVFNSENLSTVKEWLRYLCYLLFISLQILALVLLTKNQNVDKGNNVNYLSI